MDGLTILCISLMVLLVILWVFYNRYTGDIIKGLIAENAQLTKENERLKRNNERAGDAFKPMEFIAKTKPLTPEIREEWAKMLGKEPADIVAVIEPVDFPNSNDEANRC